MKRWFHLLLLALALGWAEPVRAQIYFSERYSPSLPVFSGFAHSAAVIPGGYAVIGEDGDQQTGLRHLTFRILDSLGQQLSVRSFHRPGFSFSATTGQPLHHLPDGGFASAVGAFLPNGDGTMMLWRFDAQGDTLWTRTYALNGRSFAFGSCRTRTGGFAIVGEFLPPTGGRQMLLLVTDSLGNLLWQRGYQSRPYNIARSVASMPDGGFLVGGVSFEAGANVQDAYAVRTDSLGNRIWQRRYGSGLQSGRAVVCATRDGGFAVAISLATILFNGNQYRQNQLYRYDANNQLRWQKTIGPSAPTLGAYNLMELPDGSLVAAGQDSDTTNRRPVGRGAAQGFAYKVCASGDSVWYRNYKLLLGWDSRNYLSTLIPTPDGGFVGCGFLWALPPDTGTDDAWVFKIDSAGYLQPGGAPVTVQCRPLTGTTPDSPAQPKIDLYPNPTGPDGRFSLDAPPGATLTLTDALGRQVWRKTHLALRTSDLELPHPGLFLLRLHWPDGRQLTRKLLRP